MTKPVIISGGRPASSVSSEVVSSIRPRVWGPGRTGDYGSPHPGNPREHNLYSNLDD
jgi:hypothetical protein